MDFLSEHSDQLQLDLGALADAFEIFEGDFSDGHGENP